MFEIVGASCVRDFEGKGLRGDSRDHREVNKNVVYFTMKPCLPKVSNLDSLLTVNLRSDGGKHLGVKLNNQNLLNSCGVSTLDP